MEKFTIGAPAKVGRSRANPNGEFLYCERSLLTMVCHIECDNGDTIIYSKATYNVRKQYKVSI